MNTDQYQPRRAASSRSHRHESLESVMNATPQDPMTYDAWCTEAHELGCSHARDAASWVTCNEPDDARCKLLMIEYGDPAVFDYLPREPNLGGECDYTPWSLACEITGDDEPEPYVIYAITDAYEDGVQSTFILECEANLRSVL